MKASVRLMIAAGLALVALILYNRQHIDANQFALDPTAVLSRETWNGVPFTAPDVPTIKTVMEAQSAALQTAGAKCKPFSFVWLGNSQLHYINQFKNGEHTAPYLLRKGIDCPDIQVPIAMSLPNANLQEHYVLALYALKRAPIRAVVVSLVFDDLREDGLRDEFAGLVTPADREQLRASPVGRSVLARADAGWKDGNRAEANSGLEGFVQKHIEDRLNDGLASIFSLWADRPNLRNRILIDLYYLRNAVLGIKPTSVRKLIPARYERNMESLTELAKLCAERKIPLLAYVAPIRQDQSMPYEPTQYAAWKQEAGTLLERHGAKLINLEALVPAQAWGSYHGEDVDFMHFQAKGHELLAAAVLPHIRPWLQEAD